MKKDMFTFLIGLVTGVVLGLLVRDKDKNRVKEAVSDQVNHMRKKYDELKREGKELVKEGMERVKGQNMGI
jgi:uncharacterized membrane-anchored protein YhcB (DUF1043 family)